MKSTLPVLDIRPDGETTGNYPRDWFNRTDPLADLRKELDELKRTLGVNSVEADKIKKIIDDSLGANGAINESVKSGAIKTGVEAIIDDSLKDTGAIYNSVNGENGAINTGVKAIIDDSLNVNGAINESVNEENGAINTGVKDIISKSLEDTGAITQSVNVTVDKAIRALYEKDGIIFEEFTTFNASYRKVAETVQQLKGTVEQLQLNFNTLAKLQAKLDAIQPAMETNDNLNKATKELYEEMDKDKANSEAKAVAEAAAAAAETEIEEEKAESAAA